MASTVRELINRLKQLPLDAVVGVDDGGLTLREYTGSEAESKWYFELGGIPEPEDEVSLADYQTDEEQAPDLMDVEAVLRQLNGDGPEDGPCFTVESDGFSFNILFCGDLVVSSEDGELTDRNLLEIALESARERHAVVGRHLKTSNQYDSGRSA